MILALLIATLFNTVSSTSTPCSGTTYSVPFPYGATGSTPDLVVTAGGVTIPYSSGWTINKVSSTSTGTITLATACTGTLIITRTTPRTQPTSYRTQGRLDLGALETNLDRIEMQMQESVVQGGAATLSSLSLTTPLPVASGGTGAAPPNCGAGVLTSDGTSFSCVTLSGLAPPGTSSVALQSVSPGTAQVGHINVNGNILSSFQSPPPTNVFPQGKSAGGIYLSLTNNVGVAITAWQSQMDIYPAPFNTNTQTAGSTQYAWYGPRTNKPLMAWVWDTASTGAVAGSSNCNTGVGCISTVYSGCQSASGVTGPPCISTGGVVNGTSTPLFIGGQVSTNSTNNRVITTTGAINLTSGNLFENWNNGVSKFSVGFNGNLTAAGTVTTTGVTSSGAISGTNGTFSGTLGVTGTTTLAGTNATLVTANTLIANTGLTIGSSGTSISASIRGTTSWTPGAIASGACASTTITVTGAVLGADVVATPPSVALPLTFGGVATTNTCSISLCNPTAGALTPPGGTYACRVFNP